jgi:osmotically-inducible protein OsmY
MNQRTELLFFAAAAAMAAMVGACSKVPDPAIMIPTVSTSMGNVSDGDVTEHVKTALVQDEALKSLNISVLTTKGDVLLTGGVDNQSQMDAAVKIAGAADGVHAVHNELTLKK